MTRLIHIHAKCNYFEIFEQVPESRSVQRLIQIRNNYIWYKNHFQEILPKKNKGAGARSYAYTSVMPMVIDQYNKLTVKTRVVNPELNFH